MSTYSGIHCLRPNILWLQWYVCSVIANGLFQTKASWPRIGVHAIQLWMVASAAITQQNWLFVRNQGWHARQVMGFFALLWWSAPFIRPDVFCGNGGKSNIIDAIRLISTPLSGRRELYCEQTDIRFGTVPRTFEIQATFNGLSLCREPYRASAHGLWLLREDRPGPAALAPD